MNPPRPVEDRPITLRVVRVAWLVGLAVVSTTIAAATTWTMRSADLQRLDASFGRLERTVETNASETRRRLDQLEGTGTEMRLRILERLARIEERLKIAPPADNGK